MGTLYIIPTPVGNMEDMTLRALRLLREADMILCEDTRTSRVLLSHYDIRQRVVPYHQYNEHEAVPALVARLSAGATIALVSDAGTPGISDAGFLIVKEAAAAGVAVQCLPGATACIPALVVSGLPCDRFCFEGFLPQKKGRQARLEALRDEPRTMVFYESPHRLLRCLDECAAVFGAERQAVVVREISKVHEETLRGTLALLAEHFRAAAPRGEITIVVAGDTKKRKTKTIRDNNAEQT